ncbi:MAG: sodium-dependent transporter [bacterium]|nr:sodium-dependent transporter [bacterium]
MDVNRENWGSKFGFIMATAGFAIGMGNIWRFPYIVGEGGGGAFLLVYIILTLVIGIPLLTTEVGLGRKSQLTPIAGMKALAGGKKFWHSIGWIESIAALIIMGYYLMIIAWVAVYCVEYMTGKFAVMSPEEVSTNFDELVGKPKIVFAYSLGISVMLFFIVGRGLQKGVELVSKIFMPLLLVFFIILAIWANTLEGSFEGLSWYLTPDFSKINGAVILAALGQVFFSIGVGLAAGFVFGGYLNKENSDVPGSVMMVVGFDTGIAIIAGLLIFPALFAFGLEPNSGAGLLFVTMATLFTKVPLGNFLGTVFFFLVFIAGLTSIIGLVEGITATLMDSKKWSRSKAVLVTLVATFILSIPSILSFSSWSHIKILGKDLFNFADFISGSIMLPLGGLLLSLFAAYVWGFDKFKEEINLGAGKIKVTNFWKPFVLVIIPIVIFIILINGLAGAAPG